MAYTWSIAGGTVTLTLDGSGTGQVSRSHTFTGLEPDQLYTFYLPVSVDTLAIHAFLAVAGGDTTRATVTGGETLRARGTTDGAGSITVTFGVQNIEAAPAGAGTDALDYADGTTALAEGWNTSGGVSWHQSHTVGGEGTSVAFTGNASISKTFALSPNTSYTVTCWAESSGSFWFIPFTMTLSSGANSGGDGMNGGDPATQLSGTVTTDATGNLTITLFSNDFFGNTNTFWVNQLAILGVTGGGAEADFSDLTYCVGSGLGTGGTGLGDDGNEPVPPERPGGYPPAPTGGARPFICANLPPSGFGFWNGTIIGLTTISAPNVFNGARTAGAKLFVAPVGLGGRVRDSAGRFSLPLWKAAIDAFHADARANAALEEAIADGTAFRHYLMDEPMLVSRWGRLVGFAEVEQMALYSRGYWPDWPIALRVDPTNPWFVRHMSGLTDLWASYLLARGEVTQYRNSRIAAAQALGHGLVIGMNISDFTAVGGRAATPAEVQHYGGILAASCETSAFAMWQFNATDYAQSGMPEADESVRDTLGSYDP